jgi:hypothetical protein
MREVGSLLLKPADRVRKTPPQKKTKGAELLIQKANLITWISFNGSGQAN